MIDNYIQLILDGFLNLLLNLANFILADDVSSEGFCRSELLDEGTLSSK